MIRVFSHRIALLLVTTSLLAGLVAGVAQEEEKTRKGRKKGNRAAKAAEEAVQSALPAELTDHFPIGREFKGVAIPSYTGNALKSVMTADSVIRVDEQYLDLFNLVVHVYNAAGDPETTISMDEAAYDLLAGELASKTPSTIAQPRFTMTGDKMIFQTESQVAHLIGNVRLVVPDAGQLAPDFGFPGAKPKEAKTP